MNVLANLRIRTRIGIAMPEAMVVGMPQDGHGGFAARAVEKLAEMAANVDAVVAGPGMAESDACAPIAEALLASGARIALDAALLHALKPSERQCSTVPILLPHAGELASLLDCSEEEWDDQVDTSLKGTFLMSKFALPHMIREGSGSIVNCSSS